MLYSLGCFSADCYFVLLFSSPCLPRKDAKSINHQQPIPPPSMEASGSNTGGISAAQLMDDIRKNKEDLQQRLDKLEGNVAAGQDNAAQIASYTKA